MHQLTTATSDASMASFLRRSSTARYPPAMVGQQGTFPDSGFLTYQIPTPPLSQVTFAYAHQQSNVIRDSHPQGRNGKSRYDFDTATTGPSTSGMCRKSAHQVQRWCDLFLIKGYHWYHGTIVSPTPSFSMSGRPCPCRPKRPSCHRQPKRRHTPKRTSQLVSSKRLVHDARRDLPRPRGLEDPWPCFLSARSRL